MALKGLIKVPSELGKNERERRSFTFSSVQFMNLAQIFADFQIMNVSERGSNYPRVHVHFTFILRSLL